jgi:hypothetical protein
MCPQNVYVDIHPLLKERQILSCQMVLSNDSASGEQANRNQSVRPGLYLDFSLFQKIAPRFSYLPRDLS